MTAANTIALVDANPAPAVESNRGGVAVLRHESSGRRVWSVVLDPGPAAVRVAVHDDADDAELLADDLRETVKTVSRAVSNLPDALPKALGRDCDIDACAAAILRYAQDHMGD